MRDKEAKITRLKLEFNTLCDQMGIFERPKLVFSIADYQNICDQKHRVRYTTRSRLKGFCSLNEPIIVVRVNDVYNNNHSINDLIDTLIHEMVHYRFKHMSHKDMHKRIKEIKQGRPFLFK